MIRGTASESIISVRRSAVKIKGGRGGSLVRLDAFKRAFQTLRLNLMFHGIWKKGKLMGLANDLFCDGYFGCAHGVCSAVLTANQSMKGGLWITNNLKLKAPVH